MNYSKKSDFDDFITSNQHLAMPNLDKQNVTLKCHNFAKNIVCSNDTIKTQTLNSELSKDIVNLFNENKYQEANKILWRKLLSKKYQDIMVYALAWSMIQLNLSSDEIRKTLKYAKTNLIKCRIILMICMTTTYQHLTTPYSRKEALPDTVNTVRYALSLINENDTHVKRFQKILSDLLKFYQVRHVHLENIKLIYNYAKSNNIDSNILLQTKETELGYSLSEPIFSYMLQPSEMVGNNFVGGPITLERPRNIITNKFDYIDGIVYINLENRIDRKASCSKQLNDIFGENKVHRIEAVKHKRGRIGCSLSHIKAYQLAKENNWRTMLVCEDDVDFYAESVDIDMHLAKCLHDLYDEENNCDGWDIIMLGGYFAQLSSTKHHNLKKTQYATSSHCYLIHSNYYDIMMEQFQKSVDLDIQSDLCWFPLQKRDLWYVADPIIAGQIVSDSDLIGKEQVDMMAKEAFDLKVSSNYLYSFDSHHTNL